MTNQEKKGMDDFIASVRELHEDDPISYWAAFLCVSVVLSFVLWGLVVLALKTAGTLIICTAFVCWALNSFVKNWKITTEQKNEKDT